MSTTESAPTGLLRQPALVAAMVTAVVVALGFGLIIPVLPLFARSFDVGLFAVTGLVSAFAGVRLVSNLYTGGLADRVGARRSVAWGAWIVGVSSLLVAAAPGYWWLLGLRAVGGFGSALFINALMSLVIRLVPATMRGRAVGMFQGAFLFGISFGPFVGGVLAGPLGLRWPFVIYGGACLGAGGIAIGFLPRIDGDAPNPTGAAPASATAGGSETAGVSDTAAAADAAPGSDNAAASEAAPAGRPTGMAELLRSARELCSDRAFVAALVMMAASRWSATGIRFSLVPVFATEEVGASEFVLGVALGIAAAAQLVALWPAGRVADMFGRRALAVPAYLAFAAATAALVLAGDVTSFLVILALYGVGTGLTSVTPPAIVGDVVPAERTGRAVGVLNTAGDLGSVLGPLLSGYLAEQAGYGWGFGAAAILLVGGALAAARMRETLPRDRDLAR